MDVNVQPKVMIVVLNWNGWEDTIECLESLFQIDYDNYQVIMVDNGSTDGSLEKIRNWADGKINISSRYVKYSSANKPIRYEEIADNEGSINDRKSKLLLMRSDLDLGYAKGNNLGLKCALSDPNNKYLLVLSNDTMVEPDSLSYLIEGFSISPDIGLTGPKIIDPARHSHWQSYMPHRVGLFDFIFVMPPAGRVFLRTPFAGAYLVRGDKPIKVYSIQGCAMMFGREALEKIGMFDENTFLGWEESIIAEKLIREGFSTYVIPKSGIYHKVGQGTAMMEPVEKTKAFLQSERYFLENYLRMPSYKLFVLKIAKFLMYSVIAIFSRPYRQNYFSLLKAIFWVDMERKNKTKGKVF